MRLTKFTHLVFYIFSIYIFTSLFILNARGQTSLPKGTVSGIVWVDANENSTRDSAEVGFAGVQIELYNGLTLVAKDTSDTNGFYSFGNLGDGFYRIRALRQSIPKEYIFVPWANSKHINEFWELDENLDSDVDQNQGVTGSLFLNTSSIHNRNLKFDIGIYIKFGWIEGNVWNDNNKNGIRDEINTPEKNVKIKLLDVNSDKTIDSTLTDNLGNYKFDSLITGLYSLIYFVPGVKSMTSNSYLFSNGLTQPILLNNNSLLPNYYVIDVGVVPDTLGSISGIVWDDLNKNGIREIGENPLKGFNLLLRNSDNSYYSHTSSNEDGRYIFDHLPNGIFHLTISKKKEYLFTIKDNGTDSLDSDIDPISFISDSVIIKNEDWELSKNLNSIDAGLYKSSQFGSIGGKLWNDLNKNGLIDAGEPPLVNYPVYLSDKNSLQSAATFSDGNGDYLFSEISDGEYFLNTNVSQSFELTIVNNGSNSSESYFFNPNVKHSSFGTSIYQYQIDTSKPNGDKERDIRNVNAGFFDSNVQANIFGFLYEDKNLNYKKDSLEKGITGMQVELYSAERDNFFSTTTDSIGHYRFTGIPKGIFELQFKVPLIYEDIPKDSILVYGQVIIEKDTQNVLPDKRNDLGLVRKQGVISGLAWKDITKQGIKIGEKLLPNVGVFLLDSSLRKVDSTFTDSIGNYKFQIYNSGKYLVKFASPNGLKPTKQYVSYSEFNSDVDSTGTTFFYEINLQKHSYDLSRNFSFIDGGFVPSGQIGFYTWEDKNKNGIQDETELPLPNITVILANHAGIVEGVLTDSTGKHTFENLEPDTYYLDFKTNDGYKPTLQYAGTDSTKDSDLDSFTYLIDPIILTADESGNKILSIGAGFQKLNLKGTIGDLVWKDINNNGIQENTELGANNVIIELYKDGLYFSSDTTDTNGLFSFDNLDSASYKIRVKFTSIPTDLKISTLKNQGQDNSLDSDIDSITFESDEILIDLNDISLLNRTDIDVALVSSIVANCDNTLCVPISIQIRR